METTVLNLSRSTETPEQKGLEDRLESYQGKMIQIQWGKAKEMKRKPFALANWKMTMTAAESLTFLKQLHSLAGEELLNQVQVVLCPPYTSLWPVANALKGSPLELGAQNVSEHGDVARTGQISAALLVDAGCRWVMLGHWEVRRYLGDNDQVINRKVHRCLKAGLRPILLVGEGRSEEAQDGTPLEEQISVMLAGCYEEQVSHMAFIYEPEAHLGADQPAAPEQVSKGCGRIREHLRQRWGDQAADLARIIYGGSVTPEYAAILLSDTCIDGLGASRQGRDPAAWAEIIRQIRESKKGSPQS